jgi:hypothetical protein
VICIYCLQRASVYGRRCQPCTDYLDELRTSDRQADRDYAARLVDLAVWHYAKREGGVAMRLTVRAA